MADRTRWPAARRDANLRGRRRRSPHHLDLGLQLRLHLLQLLLRRLELGLQLLLHAFMPRLLLGNRVLQLDNLVDRVFVSPKYKKSPTGLGRQEKGFEQQPERS